MTIRFNLRERTKKFSLSVLTLCRSLPASMEGRVIANQLLRSATSVGANYRAVQRARSRAEFLSKMGLVIEEADESLFWLELLRDSGLNGSPTLQSLINEAEQLVSIFVASKATAKGNR